MRNNQFLTEKLDQIWRTYFSDVPRSNLVQIKFGRKARKRLGCIRSQQCPLYEDRIHTNISINGHFKDESIPEFIVEATIAHELCHYAHGFGSPLPQLSQYPHRGGAVDREMDHRGLNDLVKREYAWLNANWLKFIKYHK